MLNYTDLDDINVAFYLKDMTCLRYFIPILRAINEINKNIQIYLFVDKTGKYNSIVSPAHIKIFNEQIQKLNIEKIKIIDFKEFKKQNLIISTQVLFSGTASDTGNGDLDHGKYFNFNKKIVVQHGFDYLGPKKGCRSSCNKTLYIVADEIYGRDIVNRMKSKAKYIVPKFPPQYWYSEEQKLYFKNYFNINDNDKVAFILYPEKGYHKIALGHTDYLSKLDFKIFIKQRRKNQLIDQAFQKINNVFSLYDDVWYPSEAVGIPLLSDLCIGYGSGGYVDISKIKCPYIDCALPAYSKLNIDIKQVNRELGQPLSRTLDEAGLPYPKPFHEKSFKYTEDHTEVIDYINNIKIDNNEKQRRTNCKLGFDKLQFTYSLLT
tara:strand:+ start:152 stop:1282 length:1131 start_codon:yes stop_codon:yes gene_type:complete